MRRRGFAVAVLILALVALSGCTSSPVAKPTTTTTATALPPPRTAAAFLAEARIGERLSLVATYKVLDTTTPPYSFTFTTVPTKRAITTFPPAARYKYETVAYGYEYEFISIGTAETTFDECLTKTTVVHWRCFGPVNMQMCGSGCLATIGSYDVEADYLLYFVPLPPNPSSVFSRVVNGFRLSCIRFGTEPSQVWCLTDRGVLGYVIGTEGFLHIELVKLSYAVPEGTFSLPSKPTRWNGFVGRTICAFAPPGWASPGMDTCER